MGVKFAIAFGSRWDGFGSFSDYSGKGAYQPAAILTGGAGVIREAALALDKSFQRRARLRHGSGNPLSGLANGSAYRATEARVEHQMRLPYYLSALIVGLFLAGCAGVQGGISAETRAALAPAGKLRVAFLSAPIYATKDPATGELKGVAVDLGKGLAQRVNVPFDAVVYPTFPELMGGARSGQWDVALMGVDPERAKVVDFSSPFMNVEQGFLVRAGVTITAASAVDVPGVRVGVLEKSSLDALLSQTLKNATIVRAKTLAENYALLDAGKSDVVAGTKPALFAAAASRPGTRVLDGGLPSDRVGMAVPKGRHAAAAAYVERFVEEAKAAGLVKSAIERAGLRGVVVTPPN